MSPEIIRQLVGWLRNSLLNGYPRCCMFLDDVSGDLNWIIKGDVTSETDLAECPFLRCCCARWVIIFGVWSSTLTAWMHSAWKDSRQRALFGYYPFWIYHRLKKLLVWTGIRDVFIDTVGDPETYKCRFGFPTTIWLLIGSVFKYSQTAVCAGKGLCQFCDWKESRCHLQGDYANNESHFCFFRREINVLHVSSGCRRGIDNCQGYPWHEVKYFFPLR